MKKQVFNPFLPLNEYIPDGEPHVFGDRIYLFGSHDTAGGARYCSEGDYVGWSAPLTDLTDWRYEGVIFDSRQDPRAEGRAVDLYAPDVVQGNDGRYYLYYCAEGLSASTWSTVIGVAVCDEPAGRYEYLGTLRNPDGSPFLQYLTADPGLINDDGVIRMYYGWSLSLVGAAANGRGGEPNHEAQSMPREQLIPIETKVFGRSEEELRALPEDLMGANVIELENDMLTVRGRAKRIVPGQLNALGSGFEGHAFYEASSIRKINGVYYFIYSSQESNELCYATSLFWDRDFQFRGTIISNGDVGYGGRRPEDRLNMTGNDHGSIECINGQWYVFHHRQTHNSTFSRQACAEPIRLLPDGSIPQVECTSCGLNGGPLQAQGSYPAAICCVLTNGHMPHITNRTLNGDIPYITHENDSQVVVNVKDGTQIGYKYFAFAGPVSLSVTVRGTGGGSLHVSDGEQELAVLVLAASEPWSTCTATIDAQGVCPLYFRYQGPESIDLLSFSFSSL